MHINRREFIANAVGLTALAASAPLQNIGAEELQFKSQVKAIAFDAFPIFDPRPVFALATQLFPGQGTELSNEWRTRQFEYTWLRVTMNRYVDFQQVTSDALSYAANKVKVEISSQQRDKLLNAYLELKPWPDVVPALNKLKTAGIRLSFLSNFTPKMLEGCIKSSGLDRMFEQVLSTDLARTYKPDPRAYQLVIDHLKLKREEILFAAFAGWDATGAKAFGYPTFWVNRLQLPREELNESPEGLGKDLSDLVNFLAIK